MIRFSSSPGIALIASTYVDILTLPEKAGMTSCTNSCREHSAAGGRNQTRYGVLISCRSLADANSTGLEEGTPWSNSYQGMRGMSSGR
jgi:hypothetical protein